MAGPTLEERVAYLEGKVEEHSRGYTLIREDIQQLRARVDALGQHLSGRIDALDQRLSGPIDALDQRLSSRIDALDQKFSRWFAWLAGILVTALLAQLGLLGAALLRR